VVRFPQGGIVAALGLRAADAELDVPSLTLRTCTTVFAGTVAPGELDIAVHVLRRGRTATQVRCEVRNSGADSGATTVAVYGASRKGPTFTDVAPPAVPPPGQCPSYRDPLPPGAEGFPPSPFWERVEGRAAIGHPPWEEHEQISSDVATWLRFDDPPLLDDGTTDPQAHIALADRMPGAIAERIGHRPPVWFAPSADLTVHLFEPLRSQWVLAHDRSRWADDGWASVESMLWDEAGAPVAYATQMVLFTYL
jgi:acyl-CoA thioesterase